MLATRACRHITALTSSWFRAASPPGRVMALALLALALLAPAAAAAPGAFNKTAPANGATGVSLTPTASWGTSSGAIYFELCIDTVSNSACDTTWSNVGPLTSITSPATLDVSRTYYWQVRARDALGGTTYANSGAWWSFTTLGPPVPDTFEKVSPANAATNVPVGPVSLTWQASSGATSYEYCYNTSAYCGVWESTTSTSKTTVPLQAGTTYHWQIRAVNTYGTTYANSGTWWTFTTAPMDAPGTFNKTKPLSGVMVDSPTAVTMMWEASKGATTYQVLLQHVGLLRDLGEHDGDQPQRVGPDGGDDLLLAHPGRQPGRHDVFEWRVVDLHDAH